MTKGRKPVPTAVKELRGNPGKRPLNDREPKGELLSGRAPRGLSPDAAHYWHRYVPKLIAMRIPVEVDELALVMMFEHASLALQARRIVEDDGITTTDEKQQVRKHPALQAFRDHSTAFHSYAGDFGMTPSARAKVRIEDEDQLTMADILFAQATAAAQQTAADPLDEFRQDGE